jgi:hypothetical protein
MLSRKIEYKDGKIYNRGSDIRGCGMKNSCGCGSSAWHLELTIEENTTCYQVCNDCNTTLQIFGEITDFDEYKIKSNLDETKVKDIFYNFQVLLDNAIEMSRDGNIYLYYEVKPDGIIIYNSKSNSINIPHFHSYSEIAQYVKEKEESQNKIILK